MVTGYLKNQGKVFGLILSVIFLTGLFLGSSIGCAQEQEQTSTAAVSEQAQMESQGMDLVNLLSQAFEKASLSVSPSVVSIIAEQEVTLQRQFGFPDDSFKDFFGEDFFKRFFGVPPGRDQKRTVRSLGSGVIVSEDGYILTNSHVVDKAQKLRVLLSAGKSYDAEVIGTDPPTDVAVIKIDAEDLPVAIYGDSDDVRVGQWVIAVGNPFQLMHTVTAGIISAKGRSSVGIADYEDFIQTDASINPGNSGGALADLNGHVIGINTAIASTTGGNMGIGFAIPIKMARQVMDELLEKGEVVRGYVGIWLQDIDEKLANALNLKSKEGVLVSDVAEDGPADKAGIRRGDVIVAYDGQKIENGDQLQNLVAVTDPGKKARLTVVRDDEKKEVTVVLGERETESKKKPKGVQPSEEQAGQKLGIGVQTLTPEIAKQLGYENETGVVITQVESGSPAAEAGLRRGDLIKEVNRREVRSVEDLKKEIENAENGDVLALLVRRGENTFFVAVELD